MSWEAFLSILLGSTFFKLPYRIIIYVEAFIGGFLVAMFFFTLTRSIHR
ncbi:hypothetical protein [Halorussus caseinilyticus]|uniref:Uncharacterized protein n=1 Tax=Halorussus caseinilyticus TaxID=3034025 RepID=A0ABD5WEL4_9EURY